MNERPCSWCHDKMAEVSIGTEKASNVLYLCSMCCAHAWVVAFDMLTPGKRHLFWSLACTRGAITAAILTQDEAL